jgi:hypothetical protein
MFIYEFGEGEGGHQGLFHLDWTPKLAATYIHIQKTMVRPSTRRRIARYSSATFLAVGWRYARPLDEMYRLSYRARLVVWRTSELTPMETWMAQVLLARKLLGDFFWH